MTENKSPSYPWYPRDFAEDEPVKLMSLEEEAVYRRLLDHQSLHGSVPSDPTQLARIAKNIPVPKMRRCWQAIAPCFVPCPDAKDRLYNRKLERVLGERDQYRRQQSESGRRGAEARWQKERPPDEPTGGANGNPIAAPLAKPWPAFADADADASAVAGKDSSAASRAREAAAEPGGPPDLAAYVIRCTVACNRGLRENAAVTGFNELVASNQTTAAQWFTEGIPIDVAEQAVYDRALSYAPSGRNRQPQSLKYFEPRVREAWEQTQGRTAETGFTPRPRASGPAPVAEEDEFQRAGREWDERVARERAGHA